MFVLNSLYQAEAIIGVYFEIQQIKIRGVIYCTMN